MDGKAQAKVLQTTLIEMLKDSGMSAATAKSILILAVKAEGGGTTAHEDLKEMIEDLKLAGKFNESKFNKFVKFIQELSGAAKAVMSIASIL